MPVLQDNPYLNAAKQPISTEIKMADGVFIKTMKAMAMSEIAYTIHVSFADSADRMLAYEAIEKLLHQLWDKPPCTLSASSERALSEADSRTATQIADPLREFRESDRLLLSRPDMARYAGHWVAAYQGRVVAFAPELASLRARLSDDRIPLPTVAIRFIEEGGNAST
jgi:hypothetical protein